MSSITHIAKFCRIGNKLNLASTFSIRPRQVASFGQKFSFLNFEKSRTTSGECERFLRRCIHTTCVSENSSTGRPNGSQPTENEQSDGKQSDEDHPKTENNQAAALILAGSVMVSCWMLYQHYSGSQVEYITWQQFVNEYLIKGEVKTIIADKSVDEVGIVLHSEAVIYGKTILPQPFMNLRKMKMNPETVEDEIRTIERELGIASSESLPIIWRDSKSIAAVVNLVMLVVVFALGYAFMRHLRVHMSNFNPFENMFKLSYTRGDKVSPSTPKLRFSDIAGMHEAKVEIKEYVEYLKTPAKYQNLGAKIPRGALLLGPPGCGKTLLAKAVATESEVPFLVLAGTDFVEMIGGLGASRMRSLFKDARGLRPCIIYIDEIDAIGRSRSGDTSSTPRSGGNESEHTLNQLLVEMDGMSDNAGIILLASTNRADVLDKALLRPGRFDRHISIDLPTLIERKELFTMYLQQINMDKPIEEHLDFLAQATPGKTGADIANICNEAALNAAREGSTTVKESNLMYALDRILAGQAKLSNTISPRERKVIAYHECGHVLVSWLMEHTDALLKVSIIPRTTAALGFAQYLPSNNKLYSKEELFQKMCVLLGGRAAETVVFNRITTGAQSDLSSVNHLAYSQIKSYGMGDSAGLLSFPSDGQEDYNLKPYSKQLQQLMDMEAQQMIAKAYKTAEQLIIENRDKLDKLCELLLKQEEMTYDEVKLAIGPPPHGEKKKVEMLTI